MKNFIENKRLNVDGAVLDKNQLCVHMEKLASDNIIVQKSNKETYPIAMLEEDFEVIKQTYKLLNNHVKMKIPIHPAGEWILDNFYIIEESVKSISKELTLKKYTNFLGLANGTYSGFARCYVLAAEMVAYTDGKVDYENLEYMLKAYQNKKNLNMDEIWNIGLFIQICLVQKIRQICESIYLAQMQKYKVEIILSKFFKEENTIKSNAIIRNNIIKTNQMKNTFIEYMSYRLKKYGRKANNYLNILEEVVNKAGLEISEVIKKEHFEIAVKKVSIGNCIISLKNIGRINFTEIFEQINGVEEILKKDPAGQYGLMDINTKIYYRNKIQELAKKTKISEIYIAKECLKLSEKSINERKKHIGYYLIGEGKDELLESLEIKNKSRINGFEKVKIYVYGIWITSLAVTFITTINSYNLLKDWLFTILIFLAVLIPIENIVAKIIQNILGKMVKPKLIPKLDFQNGIPKEYATMVVIPTIIKSKEKVKELMEKLEVYYIANKSENIYFTLLGDCSSGDKEIEEFDDEVINEGINQVKILNEKYEDRNFNKFNFIYRNRKWNENEECFMGWERKRGLLNQFNEYLLGNLKNPFRTNTIEDERNLGKEIPKVKYIITLDSDTELTLNSGLELAGAMAHILNKPVLNKNNDLVLQGHGLIQPRVGIGIEDSRISAFTQIFAGEGGTDSYTSSISDTYEDNFDEGIFTGKGIYDLEVFSEVLNNEIKENSVLSHDLLEGSYLRCGLASDVLLMDGFPTNYLSFRTRLARWIRGDYQITPWLLANIENKDGNKKKNPLNFLSRYKIFSNIVRSKLEISSVALIILFAVTSILTNKNLYYLPAIAVISIIMPFIIDLANKIFDNKDGNIKTKEFTKSIDGIRSKFYKNNIRLMCNCR